MRHTYCRYMSPLLDTQTHGGWTTQLWNNKWSGPVCQIRTHQTPTFPPTSRKRLILETIIAGSFFFPPMFVSCTATEHASSSLPRCRYPMAPQSVRDLYWYSSYFSFFVCQNCGGRGYHHPYVVLLLALGLIGACAKFRLDEL